MQRCSRRPIIKLPLLSVVLIAIGGVCFCAFGQPPASPVFEIASIHQRQGEVYRSGSLTVSSPLIRLQGYTIFGLLMDAYHLRDFQLAFAAEIPKEEIYNTMYDIVARAPGEKVPMLEDVRAMLRALLETRFGLRVHRETKEMPIYALEPGKNGPRLRASQAVGQCQVHAGLASDGRNDEETFSNCPIEELADRVRGKIDNRPVLDRTGLTGSYDFRLVVTSESRTRAQSDPADISLTSAVGELGLRLVSQKSRIDIVSVDRIEKPTEN